MLVKYKAFSINTVISNFDIQFHLLSNKDTSTTSGEQFCSLLVIREVQFKNCMEVHCFYKSRSHVYKQISNLYSFYLCYSSQSQLHGRQ